MQSEAKRNADFSKIRYAQCWEDADILTKGLQIKPGDVCLSIASAGDNALAMLVDDPEKVHAVDVNPAQLACLGLRIAAYKSLEHGELLQLIGSRPSQRRGGIYKKCRPLLSPQHRKFWDSRPESIRKGIGALGKFENYFHIFRNRVLPFVHPKKLIATLLKPKPEKDRIDFYKKRWNTWGWRMLFKIFFSKPVMARLGRDPAFFKYVKENVAESIFKRTEYALTRLDPAQNPYLHWILTGRHGKTLPPSLQKKNFEIVKSRVDRVEMHLSPLEKFIDDLGENSIDRFNLSDIFEYVNKESYEVLLGRLVKYGRKGGRLAYWNMLVPRSRPENMKDLLKPLPDLAKQLFQQDRAFFYSNFILEEIVK